MLWKNEIPTGSVVVKIVSQSEKDVNVLFRNIYELFQTRVSLQKQQHQLALMMPSLLQGQEDLIFLLQNATQTKIQSYQRVILLVCGLMFLILVAAWLISRSKIIIPIQTFLEVSQRITSENLIHEKGMEIELEKLKKISETDEIGLLANRIYEMVLDLDEAASNLTEEKKRAEKSHEAKSRFLENMAHELRTPLNAIIGYSELLIEESAEIELDIIHDLKRIQRAGKHLFGILDSIVDLSRVESGSMEIEYTTFNIRELMDEVLLVVDSIVGESRNTLKSQYPQEKAVMQGDRTKVKHILVNLLNNAMKFTQEGEVFLGVSYPEDTVHGNVMITVSDTGCGMTPLQLKVAFELFNLGDSSLPRQLGEASLSLTICKEFCEILGGKIAVESVENQGTTFTVTLPVNSSLLD